MAVLDDLVVLDFSTLLPGPLATLFLADAGATIVKVERPGRGDEMRSYEPKIGADSVNFTMLNRGKHSIAIDLKAPDAVERLRPLIERADILVEQYRPGVMDRLGLGYEAVKAINPRLIYCSITGWGQSGPKSGMAGHDLNYMAETGVLGLSVGADGAPVLPPVLAADIAGGTYPTVINLLLALIDREKTGTGARLDIAMAENLFPFLYWALGNAHGAGQWPRPGGETVTGGTPRYQIYRTRDDRFIAAAPLEEKFWQTFCDLIDLPQELRGMEVDPGQVTAEVASRIAIRDGADWVETFRGHDVCCSLVETLEEALAAPHWVARGTFERSLSADGGALPALPTIVAQPFRGEAVIPQAPLLGEARDPRFQI